MYKQSPKAMLEMVHNINIKGHPGIIFILYWWNIVQHPKNGINVMYYGIAGGAYKIFFFFFENV